MPSRGRGRQSGERRSSYQACASSLSLSTGIVAPGSAPGEPVRDVLSRPEEIHGGSSEDDVIPPAGRGDQAMKEQACVIGWLTRTAIRSDSPQSGHDVSIRPSSCSAAQMPMHPGAIPITTVRPPGHGRRWGHRRTGAPTLSRRPRGPERARARHGAVPAGHDLDPAAGGNAATSAAAGARPSSTTAHRSDCATRGRLHSSCVPPPPA